MRKHAFLIMAHKDDYTFYTLLKLLDDTRNTLFIHMDKKNKKYNPNSVYDVVHHSEVIHTHRRVNVNWGAYSQIEAELELLDTATQAGVFHYYHLISGEDLPIKSQDYIHNFFDINQGKEFVHYSKPVLNFPYRTSLYHTFQQYLNKNNRLSMLLNEKYIYIQQCLRVHRNKNISFHMGANWFDISDEFARYILTKRKWIQKVFYHTVCCDEVFVQTILMNSDFKIRLNHPSSEDSYTAIMRRIDWERSDGNSPWTFCIGDAEELSDSPMLFARKFNCKIDRDIIDYVAENLAIS